MAYFEEASLSSHVLVIGAGLAGCEASYFLAENGIKVTLIESKRLKLNEAQKMPLFAELVCTNSLKSKNLVSAHGLLKEEMKALNSLVLKAASKSSVPAGDALAVDREKFSQMITETIENHPFINVINEDIKNPEQALKKYKANWVVIATGPLTNQGLSDWLQENLFKDDLYFYDAIAPVVDADSLDYSKLYYKDRYKDDVENAAYLNVPLTESEYYQFIDELVKAKKVQAKDFEDYKFFESCLPIDIMAERGPDTARFSCMKPVGLEKEGEEIPFAVVQLRKENLLGSAFNLVGFQTRLTYPEQKRVFKTLPGFQEASFIHLGSVHRNTFLNSREHLDFDMSSKQFPYLHFAGQITGVEGYTESAASGLYVAWQILRKIEGKKAVHWPVETAQGALINYIMTVQKPCPSNINFGLIPPVSLTKEQRRFRKGRKKLKKELAVKRALKVFDTFKKEFFDD